ncbi:hypothetical protein [Caballeronia sp. LjRoot31]|uniref:hypothetical protein n=1 Tax=Caballeronia sp. LjRoot31 TaxID=3342324 RepID=UPI003ECE52EC
MDSPTEIGAAAKLIFKCVEKEFTQLRIRQTADRNLPQAAKQFQRFVGGIECATVSV